MNDMIARVRHVGIIVRDVEKSVETFKNLFDAKDEEIRFAPPLDTEAESRFAFVPVAGIEFELIQPISESFKEFLGNPAEGINHIAFVVKDIEESVRLMEEKGARLGHVTKEGILNMGRSRVAYFDPETTGGILIEFVEPIEKPKGPL
jgi:catechol 2,3-dioxygenase-like lactoylglutathione lyase family enzyme